MVAVGWTAQALDDLEAACLYIARDAPHIAQIFAARSFDAVDRLAEFPLSGRVVSEVGRSDIREIIVYSYRIIYRYSANEVAILTVHHAARPLPKGVG
ncbi:MAG TPA: type II toxin-antitoxin system RelE/ParE family toxin [Kofleriaceae bacterium]|nr:type II toxin-antitoxin system RelE/ParE family toxin [Kofleriaceae bacterium]